MQQANPFSVVYLTESLRGPEELLPYYSAYPVNRMLSVLRDNQHTFLVGRAGVGKTMILRAFEALFYEGLLRSKDSRLVDVAKGMPVGSVGIYLNLAAHNVRTLKFQGKQGPDYWFSAFADFLNTLILEQAVLSVLRLCNIVEWRTAIGFAGSDLLTNHVLRVFSDRLKQEGSFYEGFDTWDELIALLRKRKGEWAQHLNQSGPAPKGSVPLVSPLFHLADAIAEESELKAPVKFLLLIDQYEQLWEQRDIIDFRPLFNEAIKRTARSGARVEFKIATRQYSFTNFELPNRAGRIEEGREFTVVQYDDLAESFYEDFASDVVDRRLKAARLVPSGASESKVASLFARLSPTDEAAAYRGHEDSIPDKYTARFTREWERHGVSLTAAQQVCHAAKLGTRNPLVATLALIGVTRWLKKGADDPPAGIVRGPQGLTREQLLEHYFGALLDALSRHPVAKGEKPPRQSRAPNAEADKLKKLDNFVRDATHGALFILAASHKNKRKVYSGFDTLVTLSSQTAVTLIQILAAAFDRFLAQGPTLAQGVAGEQSWVPFVVPTSCQSEAVYHVCQTTYNWIASGVVGGHTLQNIIFALGSAFRPMQLDPALPKPCPNGFSIARQLDAAAYTSGAAKSRELLHQCAMWGLLDRREHNSKNKNEARRVKYNLIPILCPYFGLSEVQKKDPPYIKDLQAFMDAAERSAVSELRSMLSGHPPKDRSEHKSKPKSMFEGK